MIIDQVFKRKYSVVFGLLFLAAILLAIGLFKLFDSEMKPGTIENSTEQVDWIKYTNTDFNFTISFPKDWKISEDLTNIDSPKINIYKPEYKTELPLDNFSTEINVSIFPKGLATDAVMGRTQDVNFNLTDKTSKSFDYVLTNNTAWASLVTFAQPPKGWQPWGFIWLNTEIKDLTYKCKSGNKEVALDSCNTFEGDILERQGSIDKEIRNTQLKILSTFKFID
jgi:hypothetical protein